MATLVAATQEAVRALDGQSELRITRLPFRVGRESRSSAPAHPSSRDLRLGAAPQLNDAYLREAREGTALYMSREHFAIEYEGDQFYLLDRASSCGTIVAGTRVGGDRSGGRIALRHGDEIIVGRSRSPYVFRFELAAE